MASLRDHERREIVQRLAAFETPTEVAEWASEEYEKDVTVNQVCHYDPTRTDDTAPKWEELFRETRKAFLSDLDTLRLSHRAVRVRELTDLYEKAKKDDRDEAARLLRQVAKEVGGKFTNESRVEHSGEMDIKGVDFTPGEEDGD